jgi:hypothetical protein
MEVHSPQAPMHSWKDFWIHLGTITIGLLIAISLEQSVEELHHLHQRHQLEGDLRSEGERDKRIVEADEGKYAEDRVWLLAWRKSVDDMIANNGKIRVPYPSRNSYPTALPSDVVWITAKESSLVSLLPRSKAEIYARLYRQHDFLQEDVKQWLEEELELSTFENQFDDASRTSEPDISRMTVQDLRTYSYLLTKSLPYRNRIQGRFETFHILDEAVLSGAVSEEDLFKKMTTAHSHMTRSTYVPGTTPAIPSK